MYFHQLLCFCILRAVLGCANYVPSMPIDGCMGCNAGDVQNGGELDEFLKTQRIAQRLQSIKQQLDNHLRVHKQLKNPPTLNVLPQFLVDQLTYPLNSNDQEEETRTKDVVETKQVVLFPEETKTNCHPPNKSSVCLKFKLTDDILMTSIASAELWFSKQHFHLGRKPMQNFTIVEDYSSTKNMNKSSHVSQIRETNGWYRKDVTNMVTAWNGDQAATPHTLTILCNACATTAAYRQRRRMTKNENGSPFLLLNTKNEKKARSKRGVDCHLENGNECCRESFEVDLGRLYGYGDGFRPQKFNAYMCRGNCYHYSTVTSGKTYSELLARLRINKGGDNSLPPYCCTPNRFADLPVFFSSSDLTIENATIPNLIVESCGCI